MALAPAQFALALPRQATNPTLAPHTGGVKAEIATTGRALEFIDGSNLTAIAKDQQKYGRRQLKKVEKTQHNWCQDAPNSGLYYNVIAPLPLEAPYDTQALSFPGSRPSSPRDTLRHPGPLLSWVSPLFP